MGRDNAQNKGDRSSPQRTDITTENGVKEILQENVYSKTEHGKVQCRGNPKETFLFTLPNRLLHCLERKQ